MARGFALLSPEERKKIAAKGGGNVAAEKRSFSQNRELAAEAGRKGGNAVAPENRTFSINRELAKRAGSIGGSISSRKKVKNETK